MSQSNSREAKQQSPPYSVSPKTEKKQEDQPRARISMQIKLTFIIVGLTLISMGITALSIINTTRTALIDAANQNLLGTAKQVSTKIDDYLTANLISLQAEAQITSIQDLARSSDTLPLFERIRVNNSLVSLKSKDPYILSYSLLDKEGQVIADTRVDKTGQVIEGVMVWGTSDIPAYLGADDALQREFKSAMTFSRPYISPLKFEEECSLFYLAVPVQDIEGDSIGLLVARYDSEVFQNLIKESNNLAGDGSYGVLYLQIQHNFLHIAHGVAPEFIGKSITTYSSQQIRNLQETHLLPNLPADELSLDIPGLITNLEDALREPYFAYTEEGLTSQVAVVQLKEKPWLLAFYQPQETFLAPIAQQTTLAILLAIIVGGLSSLAAYFIARNFSAPLSHLAEVAQRVGQGNLNARAEVKTHDEIGMLAETFNTTTKQLQRTLETLEQQVAERTKHLARRAIQLRTASEVARDVTTIRERARLLTRVTQLIADRFGFYHAGIFLLNETSSHAVLQAANSEGGQRMLARGHNLEVGEAGIVGYTAATGEARIALDVGQDAVFFNNPDLPKTRSEIALPLTIENRVIGVLDVQSQQAGAFSEEDIEIIQVLADQVAVALDNAQLLEQSQNALTELEILYGERARLSWEHYLEEQPGAYRYEAGQVTPISTPEEWNNVQSESNRPHLENHRIVVPLEVRGQKIGGISFLRKEDQPIWTEDDLELVREATEQMSVVLETTRLYEDTQRRAA
ncbi:MAG: GAF domain-containing protein, partial [Chloroflexota bacterium]|nr:GAF domain-containing protein [Chloroflexota bacterium]